MTSNCIQLDVKLSKLLNWAFLCQNINVIYFSFQDSEKLTSSRPRQRNRDSLDGLCPATRLGANKASAVARWLKSKKKSVLCEWFLFRHISLSPTEPDTKGYCFTLDQTVNPDGLDVWHESIWRGGALFALFFQSFILTLQKTKRIFNQGGTHR